MCACYSVVVPFKNEEDNVKPLIDELAPVMEGLGKGWELICIDDGSTDRTREILEALLSERPYLKLIVFRENYGQSSAFDAGFQKAKGDFIITMDGDRQNDPNDIPQLIKEIDGHALVCGERTRRKDPWVKKITSRIANFIRSRVCKDGVKDTGCSLKVYRKSALDKIKMYEGMHRFLPALFTIEQFQVKSVPVNHRERTQGTTKYSFFNRSFNTIADMFAVRWMRKRRLNYEVEKETP